MSQESLRRYRGEGYGLINNTLRQALRIEDIQDKQLLTDIRNIDSLMQKGPKVRLYRGLSNIEDILAETFVIPHKNFVSASKSISIAKEFTQDGCCILGFLLPPDIKRYELKGGREDEVLIQRNIQFTIDKVYRDFQGVHIYDATVSLYTPPVINVELPRILERELDMKLIVSEWWQDLLDINMGTITKFDVDDLIKEKRALNFDPDVYETMKQELYKLCSEQKEEPDDQKEEPDDQKEEPEEQKEEPEEQKEEPDEQKE